MEDWQKGYEILKKANDEAAKYRQQIQELLKDETLTKENYSKIKSLLEKEAEIKNKAFEKIEKIHRAKTENFEQQWSHSD